MPIRIQRRRSAGWRMPENCVYVGRPFRFGNPFRVGAPHPLTGESLDAAAAVALYRAGIVAGMVWPGGPGSWFADDVDHVRHAWDAVAPHLRAVEIAMDLDDLRGMNLACWCRLDRPCHADVLIELANRPPDS